MAKVDRLVLVDGDEHEISCAVLADGVTAPVRNLLAELSARVWPDPKADRLPDEYQASMKKRFLAQVAHLADYGELEGQYNYLTEGIWELKVASLRVSFFDTPGDGSFRPKYSVKSPAVGSLPMPEEDFDEYIRVGHYFGKDGTKTPDADLKQSLKVRMEDLSHD